ncbi:hypothetical protein D3C87_1283930 [compost metagenome]
MRPLLAFGLWCIVLAKITVEVEVSQTERGTAVGKEVGLGDARKGQHGCNAGERARMRQGMLLHEKWFPLIVFIGRQGVGRPGDASMGSPLALGYWDLVNRHLR